MGREDVSSGLIGCPKGQKPQRMSTYSRDSTVTSELAGQPVRRKELSGETAWVLAMGLTD